MPLCNHSKYRSPYYAHQRGSRGNPRAGHPPSWPEQVTRSNRFSGFLLSGQIPHAFHSLLRSLLLSPERQRLNSSLYLPGFCNREVNCHVSYTRYKMISTGTWIRALKSNEAVGYQPMQNSSMQGVCWGVNYGVKLRKGYDCPTSR
jgi:hypothetical protein